MSEHTWSLQFELLQEPQRLLELWSMSPNNYSITASLKPQNITCAAAWRIRTFCSHSLHTSRRGPLRFPAEGALLRVPGSSEQGSGIQDIQRIAAVNLAAGPQPKSPPEKARLYFHVALAQCILSTHQRAPVQTLVVWRCRSKNPSMTPSESYRQGWALECGVRERYGPFEQVMSLLGGWVIISDPDYTQIPDHRKETRLIKRQLLRSSEAFERPRLS